MNAGNKKMMTLAQIIIFVGIILTAIGGLLYYTYSTKDSSQKHLELLQGDSTIKKSIDNSKDTILNSQDSNFKKIQSGIKEVKSKVSKKKPDIKVENSPNSVVQVNEKGDNLYIDKKVINQAPIPTLKVLEVVYQDSEVNENLSKKNVKLSLVENIRCYKTFIRFEYKSDSKKDYIDFKINANTILHVEMKMLDEIFETSTWLYQDKIKGIRFFNPSNGTYEMTFYTSYPILDIWKFFRFSVNNNEVPIQINK